MKTFTPALASAVTGFVRDKVGQVIAGPQFAAACNQALRTAHQQLVTVLSGDSQSIVVQGGTVYLDLAPFIDAGKQRLAAEGLTAVNVIPEVHPTIALAAADQLVRAGGRTTLWTRSPRYCRGSRCWCWRLASTWRGCGCGRSSGGSRGRGGPGPARPGPTPITPPTSAEAPA